MEQTILKLREMDKLRSRSSLINGKLFDRVQYSEADEIAYVLRKCVSKINEYGIDDSRTDRVYEALLNICGNMRTAEEANSILCSFDSEVKVCPATGELYCLGIRFGVERDVPKIGYIRRAFGDLMESLDIDYLSTFENWIYCINDLTIPSLESLTNTVVTTREVYGPIYKHVRTY